MSDFFWKKLNHIAGYAAIGVLFGLTAFAANLEIKDLDLWLHVKTGQYIVEQRSIPDHDVLSCSIAGKPWANHEWLFQVIAYGVQRHFGFDGLITMQSVVVSLTFLVLLLTVYRRDRQWLAVFTLLLVLLVYQSRFTIRPDIFSLLFFALYMHILALHLEKRWSVFALALIQVLWVNMHGFFLLGPFLVLLALAADFIKRHAPLPYEWNTVGRLSEDESKRLCLLLLVLPLVCLINPLGAQGLWYPFKILFQTGGESKIFFQHIYELRQPFDADTWSSPSENTHYKILLMISALSFFFNRRRIDLSALFLWLAFVLFSLAAIRNLIFFAAAAYLVILLNSMTVKGEDILPLRFSGEKFKDVTGIILKCLLIFWMFDYSNQLISRGYFDFDTYGRKSEYDGISKRSFPYQAVDFLVKENIKGNFFNDFNSGAYLVGRVFPNIKVFIDGRTEVYGGQFFETYQQIWKYGNKKTLAALEPKYHLTGAFLNGANQEVPVKAIQLFYGLKDWRLVYFNNDGMIFLKNTPENREIISRHAISLAKWQSPGIDLRRLGGRRVLPFPYLDRAQMLMALKFDGPALTELNTALKIAPDTMEIYQMLGDIYGHQKQYQKSFENFRIAVSFAPGNRHNRKGLAWAYEKLKDPANAVKQYERLLADKPNDAKIAKKLKKLKTQKETKQQQRK